jgi:hypothetical protein
MRQPPSNALSIKALMAKKMLEGYGEGDDESSEGAGLFDGPKRAQRDDEVLSGGARAWCVGWSGALFPLAGLAG